MPLLSDYKKAETVKVLLAGPPKGAGKTTAAMSAPGRKLLLQFDIGSPTLPPGVDSSKVWVRIYPPALPGVKLDSDKWVRPKNIGMEIIDDFNHIREAVLAGNAPVVGGQELPWALEPGRDTIILDGYVQHQQHILDWILAVNGKYNPEDFGNAYAAWGKRLNQSRILLDMIIPLPLNIAITTWSTMEVKTTQGAKGPMSIETGRIIPDLGGKLSMWGPGKVDSALYLYARKDLKKGVRYYAKTKPDEVLPWIGVRNRYDATDVVDLTIDAVDKSLPWERLFGRKA